MKNLRATATCCASCDPDNVLRCACVCALACISDVRAYRMHVLNKVMHVANTSSIHLMLFSTSTLVFVSSLIICLATCSCSNKMEQVCRILVAEIANAKALRCTRRSLECSLCRASHLCTPHNGFGWWKKRDGLHQHRLMTEQQKHWKAVHQEQVNASSSV